MGDLSKFWIVIGNDNETTRYSTFDLAKAGARELAAEHPGSQYLLFESIARFRAVAPEVRVEGFQIERGL